MYLGSWVDSQPDKPAAIMAETGETLTYAELDARSNRLAHWLRSVGVGVGDHAAILMGNSLDFFAPAWAAQRAGIFYTPINWHLSFEEADYILGDSEAKVLFTDAEQAGLARELAARHPDVVVASIGADVPGCVRLEEAASSLPSTPVADETEGVDFVYTSGTTGKPKGGVRRLPGIDPRGDTDKLILMCLRCGIERDTVYLSPGAPLYHGAPLRFCLATHRVGGTTVVMRRYDNLTALQAIQDYRVTVSQWVPAMFYRLLGLSDEEKSRYDLSSHRAAIHAAAPCPPAVKQAMIDWWGPILVEYYGASEGGILTFIDSEQWLAHPGSVGKPIFGRIHILDEDGNELGPGEVGLIYAEKGAPVTYHNDPDKTAQARNDKGWTTVGDLGHVDEDGFLHLSARRTDLIIAGGVNIYPKESEDVLIGHPAVADVAVIGIPHPEYGQEVKAVVELHDPSQASEELAAELMELCRSRLATFKCPRSVDFDPALPRVSSGKLYKQRLMDRYC